MRVTVNGAEREIASPAATVADLVREMGFEGRRIAVERNGAIVPKSRHGETPLEQGDRLEIVGAVGGGCDCRRYRKSARRQARGRVAAGVARTGAVPGPA